MLPIGRDLGDRAYTGIVHALVAEVLGASQFARVGIG